MKPRVVNLDSTAAAIKPYLPQYLQEHGIDTSKNFKCLNPKHEDKKPSMTCRSFPQSAFCFSCLEEHEKIWTSGGYKPIGEVLVSDKILQINGRLSEIIAIQKKEDTLLEIGLESFRQDTLKLTPEHLCLVVKKEEACKYLPYLALKKDSELRNYGFNKKLYGRKRISKYKDKIKIQEIQAKSVETGDYFLYPVIREEERLVQNLSAPELIFENVKGPKGDHLYELPISEDLAYLYGLYIAEGSTGRGFVKWTYNFNEQNTLASETVRILKEELNLKATLTLYPNKSTSEVTCSKTDLSKQLGYWFGEGAEFKKVPTVAFFWPKKIQNKLIQGWLDGDSGKTVSSDLAYCFFGLYVQTQRLPSLSTEPEHIDKNGVHHKTSWKISEYTKQSFKSFYEPINGTNYLWLAVKSNKPLEGVYKVVDITTLGNNTFLTKMGIVHNCGCVMDIFMAAHYLEDKPASGPKWIDDNFLYLAKKYGVAVDLADLTQEEIYEYRTYKAYEQAAELIADPEFGDYTMVDEEIARRGWDKTKLANWGVGTVNTEEFRERMRRAGFEPGFLQGIDLDKPSLFNNANLLFTVCDAEGRPVGFSAKNLKYQKDDKDSGPKYLNTSGTGLTCAIFKKGERLYGFNIAKEVPGQLYIFEGQADVITARHHGLMNCCCTMGTALTEHHINLLKRYGSFNITLVFDADEAGQMAAQKALDEKFSKEKDFRIKLCQLPQGQDPDDLLRNKGFDEFIRLKKWTAFEWRANKFLGEFGDEPTEDQRRDVAEKMIPIIVSERSHIRQEEMAKQVAKMAGYELSTIMSEIRRLRSEKEAEVQTKKRNAVESLLSQVRWNPDEAETLVAQCQIVLEDINKTVQASTESSSTLNAVLSLKEADENKTGEFSGFYLAPDGLGGIGKFLDDDWKKDNLFYIGGGEQAGKTSMCTQLAYEIANDERNNAVCIYHSIDDSARFIIYKWVCQASESLDLYLNHVSNPNYWQKQPGYNYLKPLREKAYQKIVQMSKDQKLIVKDASDGASITYAESVVRYYREMYPNKNIVLFIDNFHKLPDYGDINGHERIKKLSNHLKTLAVQNHITIVSTVEYRKLQQGEKPSNLAIAESRSLAYDASVILHLYNDLHNTSEDEAVLVHEDKRGILLPRIWVKFGKNKVSGYEGREFLDLYPQAAQLKAVDLETAVQDQKTRMAFLKENSKNLSF